MSIYYNPYLSTDGLVIRDWQHAARLYVDDTYRLAPKPKWLYYAVFNLNENAISGTSFQQQNRSELNYLVKKMDLPKFTLNTENLNQYNRKTTTYTRITYDPVTVVFHDDNNGVTNALWAMYYSHYFADRLNSQTPYSDINPPAYESHTYDAKSSFPFRYGLDVGTSFFPFFNSIQLLTLTRHKFTSYLLCHPRITSWQHDTMDQSEGNGVVENTMTLAYDAVIYTTGTVNSDNPTGFSILHYDNTESPLSSPPVYNIQQGMFSDNPFNPIDLGISVIAGSRQLSSGGNQIPFGNDVAAPILPNLLSSYETIAIPSTSGFQNYSFGGIVEEPATYQLSNAPIISNYNDGAAARLEAITSEFSTINTTGTLPSITGTLVSTPIVSDVYRSNLPTNEQSSEESKIFNGYDSGILLPESPGAVNIDYFTQSDNASLNSISNSELINNNPQFFDVPDDPFQG